MHIRKAQMEDLVPITRIYEQAREYMCQQGNPNQWTAGHPNRQTVEQDILRGESYLCVEDGEILGVFVFFMHPDPTYAKIYNGQWLNDAPYGVIHRIAVHVHRRGVASFCFDYALSQCGNLRIDTHHDNTPMRRSLEKNGFTPCGIIYTQSGGERIAYQKTV